MVWTSKSKRSELVQKERPGSDAGPFRISPRNAGERAFFTKTVSVAAMAEQMKHSKAAVRNRARRLKIVVAKSRLGPKAKGK